MQVKIFSKKDFLSVFILFTMISLYSENNTMSDINTYINTLNIHYFNVNYSYNSKLEKDLRLTLYVSYDSDMDLIFNDLNLLKKNNSYAKFIVKRIFYLDIENPSKYYENNDYYIKWDLPEITSEYYLKPFVLNSKIALSIPGNVNKEEVESLRKELEAVFATEVKHDTNMQVDLSYIHKIENSIKSYIESNNIGEYIGWEYTSNIRSKWIQHRLNINYALITKVNNYNELLQQIEKELSINDLSITLTKEIILLDLDLAPLEDLSSTQEDGIRSLSISNNDVTIRIDANKSEIEINKIINRWIEENTNK